MHVHAAFLANDAKIRDGLAYVIGGFPDSWTVPSLPATTRLTLVVVFELECREDLQASSEFGVELCHDGRAEEVATAQVAFAGTHETESGAPRFHSVVMPFDVHLRHVGPHEVRLTRTGVPIAHVRFAVRTGSTTG